mgnify:CR=1 FL=1
MPINTESDTWTNGRRIDHLEIEIQNLLRRNSEKAYTATEIISILKEEEPQVFPDKLLAENEQAEWSCIALVLSRLEKLVWVDHVDVRSVESSESDTGKELYYAYNEEGRYPLAELEIDIPEKLNDLEEEIEGETDELEDRLKRLEYRVNEKLGYI